MIKYRPPYWYHDNIKFSEDELNSLKTELDNLGSEKYTENNQCITTFFLKDESRIIALREHLYWPRRQ